jgi:hypothetical protein
MSLIMSKRELLGPSPQAAHGPGFQYVNEVSGSIEPYRAMPLLANSNMLNANELATSTPKFWGKSCEKPPVKNPLDRPPVIVINYCRLYIQTRRCGFKSLGAAAVENGVVPFSVWR